MYRNKHQPTIYHDKKKKSELKNYDKWINLLSIHDIEMAEHQIIQLLFRNLRPGDSYENKDLQNMNINLIFD